MLEEAILLSGLVHNAKVLSKKERDFLDSEKSKIQDVIIDEIVKSIKIILKENKLNLSDIEKIRNCFSRNK